MSDNGDGVLPQLPDGWVEKAAGEVLTFEYGSSLPARSRVDGEVGVYASAGRVGSHNAALVDEDVIVVGRKGAAGQAFRAEGPAWIIDTAYYATVPDDHDIRFLTYQLQAADLRRLDRSTAVPSLSRDDLRNVLLRLPPLDEQRRIVECVRRLLKEISEGEHLLDRATLLQSVLRSRSLAEMVHLSGRGAPNTWSSKTLPEVAHLSSGGTPSRSRSDYFGPGHPWVKIGDLTEGKVVTTEESITPAGLDSSSAELLPAGTVLLAMYGASIGRTGVLGVEGSTNQAICAMRPRPTEITAEYLLLVLQATKATFVTAGYGGAQPNISQRYLKGFQIPVPPLEDQERIVRRVAAMTSAIATLEETVRRSKAQAGRLRRSALSHAVSGALHRERARVSH